MFFSGFSLKINLRAHAREGVLWKKQDHDDQDHDDQDHDHQDHDRYEGYSAGRYGRFAGSTFGRVDRTPGERHGAIVGAVRRDAGTVVASAG